MFNILFNTYAFFLRFIEKVSSPVRMWFIVTYAVSGNFVQFNVTFHEGIFNRNFPMHLSRGRNVRDWTVCTKLSAWDCTWLKFFARDMSKLESCEHEKTDINLRVHVNESICSVPNVLTLHSKSVICYCQVIGLRWEATSEVFSTFFMSQKTLIF